MYLINSIIVGVLFCVSTLVTNSFAAVDGNYALNRVTTLMGQKDDIDAVIFNHDGTLLATGGDDNSIILWDSKTWKEVKRLKGHKDSVRTIAFSPNMKILASGDNGSKVILWNIETGKEIQRIKVGDDVNAIVFSPDGKFLAVASNGKNVIILDMFSTTILQNLVGHKNDIKAVAFSFDGKFLASSGSDKTVIVWDVATSKMIQQFNGHSDDVNSITFSPNGKYLASGGNDKKIILWDLPTGKIKNTFSGNLNSIKTLAFINNGEVLVSGENDSKVSCKINFWETESGKKLASERSDCSFTNFSFSPDEKFVAIAEKKVAIKQRVATTALQDEPDINGPLEFSEVALVQNVKAEELFKRAKEWLVTTLLTSNEVLQVVDKENGILIGKGSITYKPDTFMGKATLTV